MPVESSAVPLASEAGGVPSEPLPAPGWSQGGAVSTMPWGAWEATAALSGVLNTAGPTQRTGSQKVPPSQKRHAQLTKPCQLSGRPPLDTTEGQTASSATGTCSALKKAMGVVQNTSMQRMSTLISSERQRLSVGPAPSGCLIEAPWLVHGGHGASISGHGASITSRFDSPTCSVSQRRSLWSGAGRTAHAPAPSSAPRPSSHRRGNSACSGACSCVGAGGGGAV
jgi:hypothetical protein